LVRDQRGVLVQEGETAALVTARDATGDDAQRVGRAFPGAAWARALGERLAASPAFTTQTSTWDGTIGLRFGEDVVQFRIYRGRVLDCGTRTPDGPTFVLGAPDITWVRLLTGPVNDFTKRTMRGEFTVSGSAYEYLRLTSAHVALVDETRALAKEAAGCARTTCGWQAAGRACWRRARAPPCCACTPRGRTGCSGGTCSPSWPRSATASSCRTCRGTAVPSPPRAGRCATSATTPPGARS